MRELGEQRSEVGSQKPGIEILPKDLDALMGRAEVRPWRPDGWRATIPGTEWLMSGYGGDAGGALADLRSQVDVLYWKVIAALHLAARGKAWMEGGGG